MLLINKKNATKSDLDKGVDIDAGTPLGMPEGHDPTDLPGFRAYCASLSNALIGRDPEVEVAFRNLSKDSVLLYSGETVPVHGAIISEYWYELMEGEGDYEHNLRHFKGRHNLERIVFNPEDDGLTHINVYSKGKTILGRSLSNLAWAMFEHQTDGFFASVEAYWYWLSLGSCHDELRALYGYKAKKAGRAIREEMEKSGCLPTVENFNAKIKKAILLKIEQNPEILDELKASTLPLTHYYVWGDAPNVKVTYPKKFAWIHEYISDIRDYLNGNAHKVILAGSRTITDYDLVKLAYETSGVKAIEFVCGKAPGVDRLGEKLANNLELPVAEFPAKWEDENGKVNKGAGFARNAEMVKYGTYGVLVWDGKSHGTEDTKKRLLAANKPCFVYDKF